MVAQTILLGIDDFSNETERIDCMSSRQTVKWKISGENSNQASQWFSSSNFTNKEKNNACVCAYNDVSACYLPLNYHMTG